MMMIDLICSLAMLAAFITIALFYHVKRRRGAKTQSERVEQTGPSILLGRAIMEMAYLWLDPIASGCARRGISANAITSLSLAFGVAAGAALALGHFGVAALLTAVSSLGDALDGAVARKRGATSIAGEIFDAAVDRYEEMFFLGGLALYYRSDPATLGLVLSAIAGSFMVSYGTAKAEALGVAAPRGALRRAERAFCLGAGAWLSPLAQELVMLLHLPPFVADAPMLIALALIAIGANFSAIRRLAKVAHMLTERRSITPYSDLTPPPPLPKTRGGDHLLLAPPSLSRKGEGGRG
jgi:CDP-diacylglycerol---glycerol-3-phosphate 3-phosphatidyltransferase